MQTYTALEISTHTHFKLKNDGNKTKIIHFKRAYFQFVLSKAFRLLNFFFITFTSSQRNPIKFNMYSTFSSNKNQNCFRRKFAVVFVIAVDVLMFLSSSYNNENEIRHFIVWHDLLENDTKFIRTLFNVIDITWYFKENRPIHFDLIYRSHTNREIAYLWHFLQWQTYSCSCFIIFLQFLFSIFLIWLLLLCFFILCRFYFGVLSQQYMFLFLYSRCFRHTYETFSN